MLVAAVSFEILAAQQGTKATSSCASIGYSERCCPPADNCLATDGTTDTVCGCSQACRWFNDCCSDVACPAGILYIARLSAT